MTVEAAARAFRIIPNRLSPGPRAPAIAVRRKNHHRAALESAFARFAALLLGLVFSGLVLAQAAPTPNAPASSMSGGLEAAPVEGPLSILQLSAAFGASDAQPARSSLQWRIFDEKAELDGTHKLVAQSSEATPVFSLRDGNYIVHAAFGLAGATKRVTIDGKGVSERLVLNAGALRIIGQLGDAPIQPARSSISIYLPERDNSEAKLIVANSKTGDTIGLPEGSYHVVSTLLDAASNGAANPTNSVVSADLRVQAGKLTDATLRHRAAVSRDDLEARQRPRRRSARQYGLHNPDPRRRRHPRNDRRLSLAGSGRRRICRHRQARQQDLSDEFQGRLHPRPRRRGFGAIELDAALEFLQNK
jgi:hypothetical protein